MTDTNQPVSDFVSLIPTLTPAQLVLVQNYLLMEVYKRLMKAS